MAVCILRTVALAALLLAPAACLHRAWRVQTTQPPLALGTTLDARTSLTGTIALGDMDLPRIMRLSNSAYFVAISRDRLRFHVTLRHKWEEIADPTEWSAYIEDNLGRRFVPEDVDGRGLRPITHVYEQGSRFSANARPLYSINLFRGEGDYVFYRRDLLRKDLRWLMLVMRRPGYEYRYVWSFYDQDGGGETGGETRARSIVSNRLSI